MNIVNQYSVEEILKYEIANLYDFEVTDQDIGPLNICFVFIQNGGNAFSEPFLGDHDIDSSDIMTLIHRHGIKTVYQSDLFGYAFDTWHDAEVSMGILIRCLVNRVMGRKVIPDEPYFELCSEAVQQEIHAANKAKNVT